MLVDVALTRRSSVAETLRGCKRITLWQNGARLACALVHARGQPWIPSEFLKSPRKSFDQMTLRLLNER
jgi:hypothetical protein